jgi:hypothetical protein
MDRRRQFWRRCGLRILKAASGLTALLLLLFLGIQVVLSTPWMRGKVSQKISQRVGGLDVGMADLDWTPWSGVTIRSLRIEQPVELREAVSKPLLEVAEIHAWPDHAAAIRGDLSLSELRVVRPGFHVTLDMLVSIASAAIPPTEPPVVVAAAEPEPTTPNEVVPEAPPFASVSQGKGGDDAVDPPAVEAEATPEPVEVVRKRVLVVVEDGDFELVRAGMEGRLAAIEGLNLDLPLFGEVVDSSSTVALVECLGQRIEEDLKIDHKSIKDGVDFVMADDKKKSSKVFGKLVMRLATGLPMQSNLSVRLEGVDVEAADQSVAFQSGPLQCRVQGGGWLQVPVSWQVLGQVEVQQLLGKIGEGELAFDKASGSIQLVGGVLRSPDFRLIGDSASLLGNGWMTKSDGAVVVRAVLPYETVGLVNGKLGERVPKGVFAFRSLKPDNRWYSDVLIWRAASGWKIEFGKGGTVMPLEILLGGG